MTRGAWLLAAPALWATYTWGSHLAPLGRRRGATTERHIALTFDDGPDPTHTPRVLDILARERVHGAFFLIGERAAAAPDVARRIADDGHDQAGRGDPAGEHHSGSPRQLVHAETIDRAQLQPAQAQPSVQPDLRGRAGRRFVADAAHAGGDRCDRHGRGHGAAP